MAFNGRLDDTIPVRFLVSCTVIGHNANYYLEENFVIDRADHAARFRSQLGNTQC